MIIPDHNLSAFTYSHKQKLAYSNGLDECYFYCTGYIALDLPATVYLALYNELQVP